MEKIGAYTHEEVVNLMVTKYAIHGSISQQDFCDRHHDDLVRFGKHGFIMCFSEMGAHCIYFDPFSISEKFHESLSRMYMFRDPYMPLQHIYDYADENALVVYYDGKALFRLRDEEDVKKAYDNHYRAAWKYFQNKHRDEYEAAFRPLEIKGRTREDLVKFNQLLFDAAFDPESNLTNLYMRIVHPNRRYAVEHYYEVDMEYYECDGEVCLQEYYKMHDGDRLHGGAYHVFTNVHGHWVIED